MILTTDYGVDVMVKYIVMDGPVAFRGGWHSPLTLNLMKVLVLRPMSGFRRRTRFWKAERIAFLRQQLRF